MKLKDKIAIVTGAGGGIGGATARALAKEGVFVVATDVNEAAVQGLAAEISGGFKRHNVVNETDWANLIKETTDRHGVIDVLVNAAGIEGDLRQPGLSVSLEEWRRVMSVNLDGTFLGCRAVMPKMLERGMGSIVNVSSIVSSLATSTALAYGASKAGVQQLTRSIAWIGAQNGAKVRCNSVHPGPTKTRMMDEIVASLADNSGLSIDDTEKLMCAAVPLGHLAAPSDIASMIVFLAGDESKYVTGADFKVDGGMALVNAG